MASSVVVFAFLVLCCVACTYVNAQAINAACTSACTSALHVCDTNRNPALCKIIASTACTGGNADKCVAGSTCKDDECKCDTTAAGTAASSLCPPKVGYIGGVCDDMGQCTAGKGVCQGEKCICGKQGANGAVVSTNYTTYTCKTPAGYIGGDCDTNSNCTSGKGVCDKATEKCICGHSDFVTVNYATYTCIPVKSDSPPPVVPPVDKSGSGMLIMSTFLVTIVSSLSKMMM